MTDERPIPIPTIPCATAATYFSYDKAILTPLFVCTIIIKNSRLINEENAVQEAAPIRQILQPCFPY